VDLTELILIKVRKKKQAVHSNYVAKTFNFLHILSIMLPGVVKRVTLLNLYAEKKPLHPNQTLKPVQPTNGGKNLYHSPEPVD
jgi:hypothetical protein